MALCHELINSRTKKKKTCYQDNNMQYPRVHYHISYLEFILVGGNLQQLFPVHPILG